MNSQPKCKYAMLNQGRREFQGRRDQCQLQKVRERKEVRKTMISCWKDWIEGYQYPLIIHKSLLSKTGDRWMKSPKRNLTHLLNAGSENQPFYALLPHWTTLVFPANLNYFQLLLPDVRHRQKTNKHTYFRISKNSILHSWFTFQFISLVGIIFSPSISK